MALVELTFWVLTFVAFVSAVYMVIAKNPIHSAIALLVCFGAIAGHYLLLNAQFLFIVNLIVYAGAIMVLFLTTLMLMNLNEELEKHKPVIVQVSALVATIILALVVVGAISKLNALTPLPSHHNLTGDIKELGKVLLDEYFYPFEFISILLLSAMVGVVLLTKVNKKNLSL